MGLDQAILGAVSRGDAAPTFRLYGWNPATVTIGYFQSMKEEVDIAACGREGIDRIRRVTGGGAVFHDDELTYSVVVPESHPLAQGDVLATYRTICGLVIESLARLGVEASFAPINDIVSGGRKISGNAQTRKHGCLLQHGTILLSVDVEKMFRVLLVPQEKLKGKLIEDVKQRVGSVSAVVGRLVGFAEAEGAFAEGFAASLGALGYALEGGEPSAMELSEAERIARDTYGADEWNFRR
jgi:lipoate-protein ligase A